MRDKELPFGYKSPDQIETDIDNFQKIANANPEITKALNKRNEIMNSLRKQAVKKKLLHPGVLKDDRYYHHQVLKYMILKDRAKTTGANVKIYKRAWQRARKGSAEDFNTEYLQSEFLVMSQMVADIRSREILDRFNKSANIVNDLKAEAIRINDAAIMPHFEELAKAYNNALEEGKESLTAQDMYKRMLNVKQAWGISNLSKLADEGELPVDANGKYGELIEELAAIHGSEEQLPDYLMPMLFEYMGWVSETHGKEEPASKAARLVWSGIVNKRKYIKKTLGEKYVTWEDLLPEGYVTWQPDPGNRVFKAFTVTEKTVDEIIGSEETFATLLKDKKIKELLAIGPKKTQWAIPERLAKTLNGEDEFATAQPNTTIAKASKNILTTWKQWILINPLRVWRYNLNNMSGDLDISLAYDPMIAMKYAYKAAKDLKNHALGKELSDELEEELNKALKKAVIGSGITIHEIADITEEGFFKILAGENSNLITRLLKGGWNKLKKFTNWRENVLRLASYRYFNDKLAKGERPYGASKADEINSLYKKGIELDDIAAKLARELIGDYGNISQAGQYIRSHLIPFYSWMEINAPRYVRLFKNLKHEGKSAKYFTGAMAWKASKLALKATALYTIVMLWNSTFFPDEEEELGEAGRRQLHIILGRRADGTIISLRFQGALSDALEWFGLGDFPQDYQDVVEGKVPVSQKIEEMPKATAERLFRGARPFIKSGYEALAGKSFYPDMFRPRPVRDKLEHIFRTWSLDSIYRHATGKPTRGLAADLLQIVGYQTDVGESAYYDTRKWIYEYLDNKGIEKPSVSPTNKSNALYYYKQSMKYGDLEKAEKYLKKYYEFGGTRKGYKQSIKLAHPIAALPIKHRRRFMGELTPKQRETVDRAMAAEFIVFL